MKKILLILGLTCFSLLNAMSEGPLSEEKTKKEVKNYFSLSIATGNKLISCTLTPFTLAKAQELFGETSLSFLVGLQTHIIYLPIKVTIKNDTEQTLVLSTPIIENSASSIMSPEQPTNTTVSPKYYLEFTQQCELEPLSTLLSQYSTKLGPSGHAFFIATNSLFTILSLFSFYGAYTLLDLTEKKIAGGFGTLTAIGIGIFSYLYHHGLKVTKSYNNFEKTIEDLNNDDHVKIYDESVVIEPHGTFNETIFIDTRKYPKLVKELTAPSVSPTIAQLRYELT